MKCKEHSKRLGLKKWRACCTAATDCLQANCRVWKQPEELFNHWLLDLKNIIAIKDKKELRQGLKKWWAFCTAATGELLRVLNEVQRTFEEARVKEVTGLLHISDRLLAGELSRVEAARGTLQPLQIDYWMQQLVACGSGQRNSLTLVVYNSVCNFQKIINIMHISCYWGKITF